MPLGENTIEELEELAEEKGYDSTTSFQDAKCDLTLPDEYVYIYIQ